jgi:TIR domain
MVRPDGKRVVFFSHKWCARDIAFVEALARFLWGHNVISNSLVISPVVPAHSIRTTEAARIDEADCFAVLWTPEAAASAGVSREIQRARESGRLIVLLRYFDTPVPDWWNPDDAWVSIDRVVTTPCDANSRPLFPGLIDLLFGC